MVNCIRVVAWLLLAVFLACCGHNKHEAKKGSLRAEIKDTVTAYGPNTMVRNVKQDKSGNILIAASFAGVFRYDPRRAAGQSFTNLTSSKIGSRRFWDVLEDRRGNLWLSTTDSGVYFRRAGEKAFHHFTKMGLPVTRLELFMKIKLVLFGLLPEVE